MLKAYVIGAIFAGILIYFGWSHYEGLVSAKGRLTTQLAQVKEAAKEQKDNYDQLVIDKGKVDVLLADRVKKQAATEKEKEKLYAQFNELKRQKPEVKKWADEPVPDAIHNWLRDAANPDPQHGKSVPIRSLNAGNSSP